MSDQQPEYETARKARRLFLNATAFLVLFILYASLLPFNMTSSPDDVSIALFLDILLYADDASEQGQWIGHVIFMAMLSFTASLYCGVSTKGKWVYTYSSIFVFGVLVEYFQLFIGSRGTSLNDIYANTAGMVAGYLLWRLFGNFSVGAIKYFYQNQTLPVTFVRKIYLAFVIAIILFPFDFYLNSLQVEVAFATKGYPLFEHDLNQSGGTVSLIAAALLVLPLGVLYRMSESGKVKSATATLFRFTLLFLLLEILQFFEVSGQSSFLSYLFKLIGFAAGLYVGRYIKTDRLYYLILRLRGLLYLAVPVFVWLALRLKGLSLEAKTSLSTALMIVSETSFLPFRYYVDVGSGEALLSFLFNFVIFIPLGGSLAVYHIARSRQREISFNHVMSVAFLIALLFEVLVLFWGAKRPDITNILVSGFAMPVGYYIVMMIRNAVEQSPASD